MFLDNFPSLPLINSKIHLRMLSNGRIGYGPSPIRCLKSIVLCLSHRIDLSREYMQLKILSKWSYLLSGPVIPMWTLLSLTNMCGRNEIETTIKHYFHNSNSFIRCSVSHLSGPEGKREKRRALVLCWQWWKSKVQEMVKPNTERPRESRQSMNRVDWQRLFLIKL